MPRIDLIQVRRGTAAEWTSANPTLEVGEYGFETDTRQSKIGNGTDDWNTLGYLSATASSTLQEVIANGATATSKPFLQGGLSVGDGGEAIIDFDAGGGGSIEDDGGILSIFHDSGIGFTANGISKNLETILSIEDVWNASTNTPALANTDTGKKNIAYRVSVAGSQDFGAGSIAFEVDDYVINDGTIWRKFINNNQSSSSTEVATYVATNTGTVTLDCSTFDSSYRILTGNTDFQFSNTPSSGETFVKTLEVISTAGETLTFTTADKVTGTFTNDNTTVNLININFANYPTVGLRITVNITQ